MKLKGFKEFERVLKQIERESPKKLDNFLTKQAHKLVGETKQNTPVDTGTLRNSWLVEDEKMKKTVFTDVSYSAHVEYGHRTVNRINFVPGRFMLHNAVRKIEDEFYLDLNKKFGDVIKKWNS